MIETTSTGVVLLIGVPPMIGDIVFEWMFSAGVATVDLWNGPRRREGGRSYVVCKLPHDQVASWLMDLELIEHAIGKANPAETRGVLLKDPYRIQERSHKFTSDMRTLEAWRVAIEPVIRQVWPRIDIVTLIGKCAKLLVAPETAASPWRRRRTQSSLS